MWRQCQRRTTNGGGPCLTPLRRATWMIRKALAPTSRQISFFLPRHPTLRKGRHAMYRCCHAPARPPPRVLSLRKASVPVQGARPHRAGSAKGKPQWRVRGRRQRGIQLTATLSRTKLSNGSSNRSVSRAEGGASAETASGRLPHEPTHNRTHTDPRQGWVV